MTIEQLSVFLENQPGKLVEALEILAQEQIDLRALSIADTSDFGILRLIVDKPIYAFDVLVEAGFLVRSNDVIAIEISDSPGGLASVVRILAESGVNIEYAYAFVAHSHDNAYVIIRADNNDSAVKVLSTNGITMISAEAMYKM